MREGEHEFDDFDTLFASKKRASLLLSGRPSIPSNDDDDDHPMRKEEVQRKPIDFGPVHREEIVGLYQAIDIAGLQNLTPEFLSLFAPKRTMKQIMLIIESPQFSEYVRKHRALRLRRSLVEQDTGKDDGHWVWVQCKFKNASSRRRAVDLQRSIQERVDRLLRTKQPGLKRGHQNHKEHDFCDVSE
jgi:hypothetical protein